MQPVWVPKAPLAWQSLSSFPGHPWLCQSPAPHISPLGCQSCLSHALTALPCPPWPWAHPRAWVPAQYQSFPIANPRDVPVLVLGCPYIPSLDAWDMFWLPGAAPPPCRLPQLLALRGPGPCSTLRASRKHFTWNTYQPVSIWTMVLAIWFSFR